MGERDVIMLFVGTRGIRTADTVRPLAAVADVVVATSEDILADRSDQLDDSVPATAVVRAADRGRLLDEALRYAARHRVDGALTFSDDLLVDTARFAAQRGVPGQPVASVDAFRDKYRQRCALAAAGLPGPRFALITDPDDARAALGAVGLPAVLKPTRGSGSALVYIVETPEEFESCLRDAWAAAARAGGAVAPDTGFILEQLIHGDPSWHATPGFAAYVSVESVAVGGTYLHLAVTDRFPLAPPALETGMMLPSGLRPDQTAAVVTAADDALRALAFEHGLAHVEVMLTADGPVIIEVNARAGGAVPYLMALAGGVDLIGIAGRAALGRLPDAAPRFERHALFVAPQHPVGVQIVEVAGLDQVSGLSGVRAVIPLATGSGRTDDFRHTMMAVVLGVVDRPAEAVALWGDVMANLRPTYALAGAP